jgi:hypothetical protein
MMLTLDQAGVQILPAVMDHHALLVCEPVVSIAHFQKFDDVVQPNPSARFSSI